MRSTAPHWCFVPTTPDSYQLHGRLSPDGHIPLAVELDGRLVRMVRYRPRPDLGIAWDRVDRLAHIREFWELELANGLNLAIYRDLNHGRTWYLEPNAPVGPDADAACAEIDRQREASVAWLRKQAAEEEAREARRAKRLTPKTS